jgi:(S)-3,5-dihydroxyphenylglycine transaminase
MPEGGFFATLRVPFEADHAALHESAAEHGVMWVPMREFYLGAGGEREIRLSFSYLEPGEVATGIARLAGFVRTRIERDSDCADRVTAGQG